MVAHAPLGVPSACGKLASSSDDLYVIARQSQQRTVSTRGDAVSLMRRGAMADTRPSAGS